MLQNVGTFWNGHTTADQPACAVTTAWCRTDSGRRLSPGGTSSRCQRRSPESHLTVGSLEVPPEFYRLLPHTGLLAFRRQCCFRRPTPKNFLGLAKLVSDGETEAQRLKKVPKPLHGRSAMSRL